MDLKIKEFLSFCHGFMNMTGLVSFLKEGENEWLEQFSDIDIDRLLDSGWGY